jgi:hypothetical protein
LEIQERPPGPRLNIGEHSQYRISYGNFCLLRILFEVQSIIFRIAAEFAHKVNTSKQSVLAKKVLVTIPGRLWPAKTTGAEAELTGLEAVNPPGKKILTPVINFLG